jgi:hypothetical protein
MKKLRPFSALGVLAIVVACGSSMVVTGQAPQAAPKAGAEAQKKTGAPAVAKAAGRTPWGDPDLEGVWNDATSTPLERPSTVGGKAVLDDNSEEAGFQEELANDLNRDRRDGGAEVDVNRAYNEHWMDARRLKVTQDHRTSLIVDPPDGRIPPLVPVSAERQKARAASAAALARFNAGMPDTYLDFALDIRCVVRTDSPPYMPTIYNNDFQIFQSPGYVVIAPEMIHSARIIPIDGRPHVGKNLKQWLGDSRGHWEGNTLVIETTNFRPDTQMFRGADPATFKITERFIRVDATTINYEYTVEDPHTWTKPWTVRIPWNRIDPKEQMYEYACHEDNYDMSHFLEGARDREKRGETFQSSTPATGGGPK